MRKVEKMELKSRQIAKCEQGQEGITLVALIITIVVMLILAGVTINLTLGQNGIFTTAQKVAQNYTVAQNQEMGFLEGFTNEVNNIVEPEPLGTIIKTVSGVNYIADGLGNTIPVPVGFSPITTADQGTKYTGFVIKNDTDGNEFVWVPVRSIANYKRTAWSRDGWQYRQSVEGVDTASGSLKIARNDLDASVRYWIEQMPADEEESVSIYGGYYIGRYEAGIINGTLTSESSDSLTDTEKQNWTGYTGENIKVVVQNNQEVWNYITRDRAITEVQKLYNKKDDNIKSKLCSSYAWDTALKFIESTNNTYPVNSIGGNYISASGQTGEIKSTGQDTIHPCNIYDMGGNVYEWTTESYSVKVNECTFRGGNGKITALNGPAGHRLSQSCTYAVEGIGFRVALFM